MKLYILKLGMTSSGTLEDRKRLSTKRETITYVFPEETRKKIETTRAKHRYHILTTHGFSFHGMHIVQHDDISEIERMVAAANKDLKEINDQLQAKLIPIEIDVDRKKSELYDMVTSAIRTAAQEKLVERLKRIAKEEKVPPQSRRGSSRSATKLDRWNILDDADVRADIQKVREAFEADELAPSDKSIEDAITGLTGGQGSWLDF